MQPERVVLHRPTPGRQPQCRRPGPRGPFVLGLVSQEITLCSFTKKGKQDLCASDHLCYLSVHVH